MSEEFKSSKYFKYLLENSDELDRERIQFNEEIRELLNRETDELGTVLKCHLIIEYYIDLYLRVAYPTVLNWEKTRLTFNQKLELINNHRTPLGMYYDSIKCLNKIRNKFSHQILYVIQSNDYREIEDIMTVWKNAFNEPVPKGLELIESFTVWICGSINNMINGINKHAKDSGLPGYLKWLQVMNEKDN